MAFGHGHGFTDTTGNAIMVAAIILVLARVVLPLRKISRMKKAFRIARVAAFASLAASFPLTAVSAAPAIDVLVRGTVHQALFAVDFEGQNGVAVGADGEVQSTVDGAKTWTESKLPTDLALLGVHTDSARTLAVGQAGTIFLRRAGGQWEKVKSETERRLFSVSSNASGLSAAVGEFGALQVSEDGGATWQTISLDWLKIGTEGGAEPHLYGVNVAADGAISVVGEFGLVLRSADRGRTWSVQSKGTASLFAIQILEDGKGFAVGQDGYALKTRDHGLTWVGLDIGSRAILNGVHAAPDGQVVVTAMRELLVSKDGGDTWTAVNNPEVTTAWFVGVGASGPNVVAVGQAGRIIRVGSPAGP